MKEDLIKKLQNQLINDGYKVKRADEIDKDIKLRTGIFALDYVLGGGISQSKNGHRIEFFGSESSGKTTFTLYIIKRFQELNKTCVFIDAEKSFDQEWAETLGLDTKKLLIAEPESLEHAGTLMVTLIKEGIDLIIIDSIVSLCPEEEVEREINEPTMALQARINSLICRKLEENLGEKPITIIFINQLRDKVGGYGNPHTTSGGRALKHFCNTRIEFKLDEPIDIGSNENKERIGYVIKLHGEKNKKGKPKRKATIDFYFTGKIDNTKSLFFNAVKFGIIKKSGAWFEYKDIREQGKEKLIEKITKEDWAIIEEELWKVIQ